MYDRVIKFPLSVFSFLAIIITLIFFMIQLISMAILFKTEKIAQLIIRSG